MSALATSQTSIEERAECPFKIVVDTREQRPWTFENISGGHRHGHQPLVVETVRAGLPTGDYSIEGYESRIALERKEASDFLGCVTRERPRFERELQRLNVFEVAAVIIEAPVSDLCSGKSRSQVTPAAVSGSLIAWGQRYPKIQWWFLPDRRWAEAWAYHVLERFWRDQDCGW